MEKERIKKSPNYKNGIFINLEETPMMAEDASMLKTMRQFIKGNKNGKPKNAIETIKFDRESFLKDNNKLSFIWLGHSTLLIKLNGIVILTDPVFSKYASPVPYSNGSFKYTNTYKIDDLPEIDMVLLSHDHYDHLDKKSIKKLKNKAKMFYAPLGLKRYLLKWGVDATKIVIADWWEEFQDKTGIKLTACPSRHFSGRGIHNRNKTLWCSWTIESKTNKVFFSGDSGYGLHYKEIGDKYGPFDLAFIECGQYHHNWRYIHALPEQTVQANIDLRSKSLLPIHWGKFRLSLHDWTEPIDRAKKEASSKGQQLIDAKIGETNTIL